MRELNDWIKLFRPPLLILGFLASFSLMYYTGKWGSLESILILLSIGFGNMYFNLMNEIMDVRQDRINKPWKPLPSRKIDIMVAREISDYLLLLTLTLVLILIILDRFYLIAIIGFIGGYVYNVFSRRDIIGNVALCTTYTVAAYMSSYPYLLDFAVAFGLTTMAFNIGVQIQDMEADKIAGVKTIPLQIGSGNSRILAFIILSITFLLSFESNIPYITKVVFFGILLSILIPIFFDRYYEICIRCLARLLMIMMFISLIFVG